MTIWTFQRFVSRALLAWSAVSAGIGFALRMWGTPFSRGVSDQFLGWPVINGGIALFGAFSAARREWTLDDAATPERRTREARNLRRLLAINAGLDLAYMTGGLALLLRRGASPRARGAGLGILLQGAFLFTFDSLLSLRVPDVQPRSG
ncbi:MAG: hypothetical protein U0452_11805 [Anaerolineae bacterium]